MFWLLIAWYQQNNFRFRNLAQYTRETYTIRLGVRLIGLVLGRSPAGFVQKFANQFFRPESNVLCSCQISFNLIFSQDTQLQNKYFQNSLMSTIHSLWLLNIDSASWERLFFFIWLVIWYSWVWKKKYLLLFCKELGKSLKFCIQKSVGTDPFFDLFC